MKNKKLLNLKNKKNHRTIGEKLNLFHFQKNCPGFIFWHNDGCIIINIIKKYIKKIYHKNNFEIIKTPNILKLKLWEMTGHLNIYKKNMFIIKTIKSLYALKPMNCPSHIQVYNSKLRTYKQLPIKYGEFGNCFRYESSGSLNGLFRTRNFTQDDGHIFCLKKHIEKEIKKFHKNAMKTYKIFGFNNIKIKLSLRPINKIGSNNIWDKSENLLRKILNKLNIKYNEVLNEGAFYGPKIEYHLKDSLNRFWQCGTIQLDFITSKKLNVKYLDKNNKIKYPVILHRAILGSLERFIGILLENYLEYIPFWLSPKQFIIINMFKKYLKYFKYIKNKFKINNFRFNTDISYDDIRYLIKKYSIFIKPYFIFIIGKKEYETNTISVRNRNGINLGNVNIKYLIKYMKFKLILK